jgi:hypothetical protein
MALSFCLETDDLRVEAPVTRRSPHSAGREDFPHLMCNRT